MYFIKLFENFKKNNITDEILDIIKYRFFENYLDKLNITDQRDNNIGDIHTIVIEDRYIIMIEILYYRFHLHKSPEPTIFHTKKFTQLLDILKDTHNLINPDTTFGFNGSNNFCKIIYEK
jgi:hypothetical protein